MYKYLQGKQLVDQRKQFSRDAPNKIFQFCPGYDPDDVTPEEKREYNTLST
jgi:hypothetical protein